MSSLRNRLLAEMFYLTGDIERYGTGFIRIREYLKEYPEVSIFVEEMGDFFKVDLRLTPPINAARPFQLLNAIGLKNGIHPARMYKLVKSTNIVPGELVKRSYPYRTDLEEGLLRWIKDEPAGEFV